MADDIRADLASVAASLRAYLEWQHDCGSSGIPRRPRGEAPVRRPPPPVAVVEAAPLRNDDALPPDYQEPPPGYEEPPPGYYESASEPAPAPPPAREPEPARERLEPIIITNPIPEITRPKGPAAAPSPRLVASRPLDIVQAEVTGCTKCALAATRTNTVFARGNPKAKLCIVGEAPGADEDASGLPFVGRAGQLLDKMVRAMGLSPETDVYVCNIIKCRPPGNRKPEADEIATCIPYLHEQLSQVDPRAIVAMGNTAVAALLGTTLGITKVRGSWKLYRGKTPVMPTYHPSYLLRPGPAQAEAKRQAWEDLQIVMKELGLSKPPKA